MRFAYTPYFCEENIYLLLQNFMSGSEPKVASRQASSNYHVVFITNPYRSCALMNQRAAAPGKLVFWDYHVVLLDKGSQGFYEVAPETAGEKELLGRDSLIWDLDTRLSLPCPASEYAARTFPGNSASSADWNLPAVHLPLFRVIDALHYLHNFSSDRRHMRDDNGAWLQPPPPWALIRGEAAETENELSRILDFEDGKWEPFVEAFPASQ